MNGNLSKQAGLPVDRWGEDRCPLTDTQKMINQIIGTIKCGLHVDVLQFRGKEEKSRLTTIFSGHISKRNIHVWYDLMHDILKYTLCDRLSLIILSRVFSVLGVMQLLLSLLMVSSGQINDTWLLLAPHLQCRTSIFHDFLFTTLRTSRCSRLTPASCLDLTTADAFSCQM